MEPETIGNINYQESLPYAAAALMFTAFVVEAVLSYRSRDSSGRAIYGRRDTLTSLWTVAGYAAATLLRGGLIGGLLVQAYEVAPFHRTSLGVVDWFIALVVVDFFYYWSHRLSHSVPLLWAFHTPHHSSEHFNLSLGLRNSWFGGFLDWVFLVPALLLGFDPIAVGAVVAVQQTWDFLCHTPHVGYSSLDKVFNTPSNHRVHHSSAEEHLQCNFGGVFVLWDQIFGTYVPQTGPLHYGLRVPPRRPFNPFYLQVFQFWSARRERSHD